MQIQISQTITDEIKKSVKSVIQSVHSVSPAVSYLNAIYVLLLPYIHIDKLLQKNPIYCAD